MVLEQFIQVSLSNPIIQSIEVGAIRAVAGYLENVIKGTEQFDVKKFFETIVRVFPQALGLSAAGLPPVTALFTDWSVGKIAKIGKK